MRAPPSPLPWLPWVVQSKQHQCNCSSYQSWATMTTARCFCIYWTLASTVVTNLHGSHVKCAGTLHLTADPKKHWLDFCYWCTSILESTQIVPRDWTKVELGSSPKTSIAEMKQKQTQFLFLDLWYSPTKTDLSCFQYLSPSPIPDRTADNSQWVLPTSLSLYRTPHFWSISHCFIKS